MSDRTTPNKMMPFLKRDGVIGPFMAGILVIGIMGYILLNEIYWVEDAPGSIAEVSTELFIVLAPGIVIIATLFAMAFNRSRGYVRTFKERKSESNNEIRIDKI